MLTVGPTVEIKLRHGREGTSENASELVLFFDWIISIGDLSC